MTSLYKLPAPPEGTRHVRRQAGGHLEQNGDATIPNLEHSDGSFLKLYRRPQRGDTELAFYKRVMNERDTDASLEALRPLVPKFDGIYTTTYNGIEVKYLKVEDITRRFTHPCILDIKLKAHVHDPSSIHDHPTYIFAKQQGFLIDGMQVYDIVNRKYIALFKDFGRKLDDNGVKEAFCRFLNPSGRVSPSMVSAFLQRLQKVRSWASSQKHFALYRSSLLLVYDACAASSASLVQALAATDVRMVDFAKVYPCDQGDPLYFTAVSNLVTYFEELLPKIDQS